jgi:hypothetical protein
VHVPHDSLHVTHIVTLCKNLVCDNEDKEDDAEVAMLTEVYINTCERGDNTSCSCSKLCYCISLLLQPI